MSWRLSLTLKPAGLYSWSHRGGSRLSKLGRSLWLWGPKSCHYVLHETHKLLLQEYLLLMHLLLLLLHGLLLPLELVLSSLKLGKSSSCLLCLSIMCLLHPLKNSNESGVCLRSRWSRTRATGLCIVSMWRHLRNRQIVIVRAVTVLAHLLLCL